ncbi:polyprenyl synthetase family protein [Pullulanibacillus pueri]|uniref:Heptaprenyl diphosphate synthase component 2 n=1 Tax=Pullulanibacillus pueri TaxID=1437324 RepID=A0A8J3EKZ6_9BACL|nr:polyprenyl synthetase family protein [Pullulanibacillus pueri]GGH78984.1 heptaprenyl diphosphate synthase component 2 [Pullulanibacillus pueri]
MSLATIYKEIKHELNAIEKLLETVVEADQDILTQASSQLLKAGGKRMRPIMVLLAAQYGERDREDVRKIAVALELIHMASLVHDDVIDNSEMRRGQQTVKSRWDNRVAMYTGDYIFSRSLKLASEIEIPEVHQILSHTMKEISLGEIEQIEDQYNWTQNVRTYFLRIKRKTALLMAISCQLGAIAAGAPEKVCRHLYYFGYYTGMSYQIIDDVLDFTATEKQLGKPAASDIKQGNVTLPTLIALRKENTAERLMTALKKGDKKTHDWDAIIQLIKDSGSTSEAEKVSTQYIKKAYDQLTYLPQTKTTKHMERIADYISKRKY